MASEIQRLREMSQRLSAQGSREINALKETAKLTSKRRHELIDAEFSYKRKRVLVDFEGVQNAVERFKVQALQWVEAIAESNLRAATINRDSDLERLKVEEERAKLDARVEDDAAMQQIVMRSGLHEDRVTALDNRKVDMIMERRRRLDGQCQCQASEAVQTFAPPRPYPQPHPRATLSNAPKAPTLTGRIGPSSSRIERK